MCYSTDGVRGKLKNDGRGISQYSAIPVVESMISFIAVKHIINLIALNELTSPLHRYIFTIVHWNFSGIYFFLAENNFKIVFVFFPSIIYNFNGFLSKIRSSFENWYRVSLIITC